MNKHEILLGPLLIIIIFSLLDYKKIPNELVYYNIYSVLCTEAYYSV